LTDYGVIAYVRGVGRRLSAGAPRGTRVDPLIALRTE
jgi:hypothetical protein